MKRIYQFVTAPLLLVAGCYVLAQQRQAERPKIPKTDTVPTLTKDNVTKDDISGRASMLAVQAKFNQSQAIYQQGQSAVAAGHFAQGETLFRKAIAIAPFDGVAYFLLADVCERQGKQAEALIAYRALIYPVGWGSGIADDLPTRMRYILALLRIHEWEEAVRIYDETLTSTTQINGKPWSDQRFDPNRSDESGLKALAHFELGLCYSPMGEPNPEEQRKHLETAVHLKPRWGAAHDALAEAMEKQGQRQSAKEEHARAAALGFHDSRQEREAREDDETMRETIFFYDPNQLQSYHFHNPQMRPTPQEVAQYQKTGQYPPSVATLREGRSKQESLTRQP